MYYKEENGSVVLKLGTGDTFVCLLSIKDGTHDGIGFVNDKPGDIGRPGINFKGKNTDGFDIPVKIIFSDKRSIRVVIEELKALEKVFGEKEQLNVEEVEKTVKKDITSDKTYVCTDCIGVFNSESIAEIIDEEEFTCVCKTCDTYNKYIRR